MIKVHACEKMIVDCYISMDAVVIEEKADPEIIKFVQGKLNEAAGETVVCFYHKVNDVIQPVIDGQVVQVYHNGIGGEYYVDLNALTHQVVNNHHTHDDDSEVIEHIQLDPLYDTKQRNPISFRATIIANIIRAKKLDEKLLEGIFSFGYRPVLDLTIERLNPIQTDPIDKQISQFLSNLKEMGVISGTYIYGESDHLPCTDMRQRHKYVYEFSNGRISTVEK